jgi:hypothetical protein
MAEQSSEAPVRYRTRYRNRGCGAGCASFFLVLTAGIVLSLLNAGIGIGVSVRIPFTESNVTVAGSIGAKDRTAGNLPGYTEGRLGGNQNFFNNSTTMTIGPAEGAAIIVVGRQPSAPPVDLHLVVR